MFTPAQCKHLIVCFISDYMSKLTSIYEFSPIFPFPKRTLMNPETVSAAESHFYSDDYWLRFRDDEQEKRGRRKRGRMEEEQSDENHPTHCELNQEKTRLKTQRPNLKRIVFKGDFFSMDPDENLLNIFLLLLMTSQLPLVNMTAFYLYSCVFTHTRKKFCSFHVRIVLHFYKILVSFRATSVSTVLCSNYRIYNKIRKKVRFQDQRFINNNSFENMCW